MPKMDGIELSNKILELDANVKICLVMRRIKHRSFEGTIPYKKHWMYYQ